ncbi:MAG: hypothetical protein U5L07_07940 [Desulfobacterales bacterium]|nr:hypothetical protein [Desulfobacterales bacterium]
MEGISALVNKMGIIGDSDFVEHIRQTYLEKDSGKSHREPPQLKVARNYWMPEDLIKKFLKFSEKTKMKFAGGVKTPRIAPF